MEQMEVLNRDYKSANISWNFINITRIHNPDWFVNAWPGSYALFLCLALFHLADVSPYSPQEIEMKQTYHKGNSSALNIFTAGYDPLICTCCTI